jgi:hypothetical protein
MYFQPRKFNVYFDPFVRKSVSVNLVFRSCKCCITPVWKKRSNMSWNASVKTAKQLKYLHRFQRGNNQMNKHPNYAIYLYIWGKECVKIMSGVVPKKCVPLYTVKCDQHFVNLKWFPRPSAPYFPASIKQYWNTGEAVHYRYDFKVYFISIYCLKLRRCFAKNYIMPII